ncbi:MAG: DUF1836 domain-containing protein [Clostridia bacterium]|nr:DUF1836 domain-containing protein [Clostridia bacterium]
MIDLNFDINNFHIPRWDEIPNIDLYMDQVLSYVEKNLPIYINDENDTLITKTMINNYVKQDIIAPPVKKKYNRTHIAELFVICILKQVYAMSDIKNLIDLALKTSPIDICYDNFCNILEQSLNSTFNGEEFSLVENLPHEQYLLRNVVQSFSCKLYVQFSYLNKMIDDKSTVSSLQDT